MVMAAINWKELDKKPKTEQKAFFDGKFKVETISYFHEIKKGDHLVREGKFGFYYHHFLCIGHDEERNPKIIHYYGTSSQALNYLCPCSVSSSEDLGPLAKVHEVVLPNKDFLKDEAELKAVKRLVWPPQMRRFSVDEVVKRACRRKEEQYYDLTKNNCENFVMWSLFDMNISLQVKTGHVVCKESLSALRYAGSSELPKAAIQGTVYGISLNVQYLCEVAYEFRGLRLTPEFWNSLRNVEASLVDDGIILAFQCSPTQISSASSGLSALSQQLLAQYQSPYFAFWTLYLPKLPDLVVKIPKTASAAATQSSSKMAVGAATGVGALFEIGRVVYGIDQAYKQWKGDGNQPGGILIKSREEFIRKAIGTIATGASSTLGMMAGQALIPIPLLGGVVGGWVGRMVGELFN